MPTPRSPADGEFLIEPEALLRDRGAAILVDTRPAKSYAAGHIPGAIALSTYDRFTPGTRPAELAGFRRELAAVYGTAGLTRDRPIVVYEDITGMRAARDLWLLEYLGHTGARMLHGGLEAWIAAGGPVTQEPAALPAATFAAGEVPALVIGSDEIVAPGAKDRLLLLDVRDDNEFRGRDHTACCARRGRLPGARWLEWTEFLGSDGRFLAPEAIRARLAALGADAGRTIVPYCHRGARSANSYYALRHAGYTAVRNYIGSWHDWSARTDLPLEV
jgi:thiosulfate/3-mercaptopyruvate sulfurtransferase